jgi:hypothetical protein
MRIRHLLVAAAFTLATFQTRQAWAGMPTPVLTDWAALRIETLSFFIAAFLFCAMLMRWLWNYLARDFPAMPRLGYRKTLAAAVLLAMLLAVVLTMIAGARELLTPGAWQKQGLLYKVVPAQPPVVDPPAPTVAQPLGQRMESLQKLHDALSGYARQHKGRFPKDAAATGVEPALWEVPGMAGVRYLYVPGLEDEKSRPRILVYEPNVFGDRQRLALRTNGEVVILSTAELHKQLPGKKP